MGGLLRQQQADCSGLHRMSCSRSRTLDQEEGGGCSGGKHATEGDPDGSFIPLILVQGATDRGVNGVGVGCEALPEQCTPTLSRGGPAGHFGRTRGCASGD